MLRGLGAILIALWSACAATAAPVVDLSALKEARCSGLGAYDWVLGDKLFARCATLILPQGPHNSRTVEIAVAVIEPTDPAKAKNTPTVIIHGGPGVGIVDAWWWFASMDFVQDAPVILFDQRGAGLSEPNCARNSIMTIPSTTKSPPANGLDWVSKRPKPASPS